MSDKNIEIMKKIIEEKQKKSLEKGNNLRAKKTIGQHKKASRSSKKSGGLFDK